MVAEPEVAKETNAYDSGSPPSTPPC